MRNGDKILNIQELGTGDIQKRVREGQDLILIPIGSCERHGNPFTPLGLDGLVSKAVVERTARETDILHTPLMPFGYAPEHFGREGEGCGTISFRAETYRLILEEISRSLIFHGFNKLIFVSLHSSNVAVAEDVLLSLRTKTGAFVAFYGGRENKQAMDIMGSEPDRLSSDIECSVAMYLMEKRFKTVDFLSHGYRVHAPGWLGEPFYKRAGTGIAVGYEGAENITLGMDDYEYVSRVTHEKKRDSEATAEKGQRLLDALSSHLTAFVNEVKKLRIEAKYRSYPDRVR
jgi:creatinine amidohydrolase